MGKAVQVRKPRGSGHERRAEIMAAAREVFLADGVGNASMRKIAARLGLSSTALYVYFQDKDHLLHELCRETFQKLGAAFSGLDAEPADPFARLVQMMRVYADFALQHPDEYRLTFLMEHRHPYGPMPDHLPDPDNPYFDGMAAFYVLVHELQRLADAGHIDCPDARVLAQVVWTGVHGLVTALICEHDFPWAPREMLYELYARTLIQGLKKTPA